MNFPTVVMLNSFKSLLWLPVNNGMSKGGMSRINELITPSNSRGGGEEEEELARGDDASAILFANIKQKNRLLIRWLLR
jgi:hypothetical protein